MITDDLDSLFKGSNRKLAAALVEIVRDMRDYWPLTVRQIYYQCVSRLVISNKEAEYRRVSRNLTTIRRHDLLPWHAIEDRTRRTIGKRGYEDVSEFVRGQVEMFLDPDLYGRCYIQEQEVYVEVCSEKDALARILQDAVWPFCTRLNVVRGQVSATMVQQMGERFDRSVMLGKRPILVYFGDLDPSGIAIPKALVRNLADWHGVEVELRRAALNPEQVGSYRLPVSLDAAKRKDPNYSTWLAEYGDQAPVELDALHPQDLSDLVTGALKGVYDLSKMYAQKEKEKQERALLKTMRLGVMDLLGEKWPDLFAGG